MLEITSYSKYYNYIKVAYLLSLYVDIPNLIKSPAFPASPSISKTKSILGLWNLVTSEAPKVPATPNVPLVAFQAVSKMSLF
mgnify:CR=1 FL=1